MVLWGRGDLSSSAVFSISSLSRLTVVYHIQWRRDQAVQLTPVTRLQKPLMELHLHQLFKLQPLFSAEQKWELLEWRTLKGQNVADWT